MSRAALALLLRYIRCLQAVNVSFFFFNDTATTEIYTLSLHDALPIWSPRSSSRGGSGRARPACASSYRARPKSDRKSTRLNSSHSQISYAVFCLKKKKKNHTMRIPPLMHIQDCEVPAQSDAYRYLHTH